MLRLSDVDPEDEDLEEPGEPPFYYDEALDAEDICEHGLDFDDCDICSDELEDDDPCVHGVSEFDNCPICDGDEDPDGLDEEPDD